MVAGQAVCSIQPCECCLTRLVPVLFHHYRLVYRIEENEKKKMVIVRARLVEQHQVLSYYDTVLYSNSRVLYSTVKKKKKKWQTCHRVPRCWPHSTICRSPGQGIGRPGLMVTSHCADRISGRWVTFLTLHNRSRSHFRFRKRMWRHPRWRTEAEMAPAPGMERWESYLHYFWDWSYEIHCLIKQPWRFIIRYWIPLAVHQRYIINIHTM